MVFWGRGVHKEEQGCSWVLAYPRELFCHSQTDLT